MAKPTQTKGCSHNETIYNRERKASEHSSINMKMRSIIRGLVSRYNLGANKRYQYDPRVVKVAEEVRDAIATGRPVVALESTIYTHGYPYEQNVELALRLEAIVRENGAVPATIGIIDGVANIGMARENLVRLASTRGNAIKISRRDLSFIIGLVCYEHRPISPLI